MERQCQRTNNQDAVNMIKDFNNTRLYFQGLCFTGRGDNKGGNKRRWQAMSNLPIGEVLCGDCIEIMKTLPDNSIDACVTDPPY